MTVSKNKEPLMTAIRASQVLTRLLRTFDNLGYMNSYQPDQQDREAIRYARDLCAGVAISPRKKERP